MKKIWWSAAVVAVLIQVSLAAEPAPINFNLVKVNPYNRPVRADSAATPNQRVVIDVQNPNAAKSLVPVSSSAAQPKPTAVMNMAVSSVPVDRGIQLPWESNMILHTASGSDSFLVASSRTGCPGTVVRPSVSVAFATSHGWSNPPIRFGPLSDKTICPLGRGVELHVSSVGSSAPFVKIAKSGDTFSRR